MNEVCSNTLGSNLWKNCVPVTLHLMSCFREFSCEMQHGIPDSNSRITRIINHSHITPIIDPQGKKPVGRTENRTQLTSEVKCAMDVSKPQSPSPDTTFLTQDPCGIALRSLVSEGHVLIARVLRASNEIPSCFRYDYTLQKHDRASVPFGTDDPLAYTNAGDETIGGNSKGNGGVKNSISSMWKKLSTKMSGNAQSVGVGKILIRQADSYNQITPDTGRIFIDSNDVNSGVDAGASKWEIPSSGTAAGSDENVDTSLDASVNVDEDAKRYKSILVDFRYLLNPERYDCFEESMGTDDDNSGNGSGSSTSNSYTQNNTNSDAESATAAATTTTRRGYSNVTQQENLEQEFRVRYQKTLTKFYTLFTDICSYYHDINSFINDLDSGHYVQYTLESLLTENLDISGGSNSGGGSVGENNVGGMVGRQLLCEMLYLYTNVLILLDLYIPGTIRERFIIAHHRYSDDSTNKSPNATGFSIASNFETICSFFQRSNSEKPFLTDKSSGASSGGSSTIMTVPSIHDIFLTRMPLPPSFVHNIIQCLISSDIYPLRSKAFPSFDPSHQTTKLSTQGYMLVVILFLQPTILQKNEVTIRKIVDRFYIGDNWMIPLYNGHVLDLSIEWGADGNKRRYPAAASVLEPKVEIERVRKLQQKNTQDMKTSIEELKRYLNQNMCHLYVLEHDAKLLDCMRKANIALRWRMLHHRSAVLRKSASYQEPSTGNTISTEERSLVDLFLLASRFESSLHDSYQQLLEEKVDLWREFKQNVKTKMQQLSSHFSGNESLVMVEKNDSIGQWFSQMVKEINELEYQTTGRDVQYCIDSLNDVIKLDAIDRNAQVKEVISEACTALLRMVQLGNIHNNICIIVGTIADCEYARTAMEYYVPIFHWRSMKDPKSVAFLRPSFLKMASFLSSKLTPHLNANSQGQRIVKHLHTQALLCFVKEILDVIPKSIFSCLGQIVGIKENRSLTRLPAKIEVDRLWDHAHLNDRYNLAKLTFELSVLTKGIIDMEEIGSLQMNPQHLLEEGLRKELVRQISNAFHSNIQFLSKKQRGVDVTKNQHTNFVTAFRALDNHMQRFQSAIIWLQDFLRINGLEIFLQESTRVIWHSVNMELGSSKSSISTPYANISGGVHIPTFPITFDDKKSVTFMGRVVSALTRMIDPKVTLYSRHLGSWFAFDGKAICDAETFSLIRRTIGVQGIMGVDTLLCHKVSNELRSFLKFYHNSMVQYGVTLEKFRDGIFPEWRPPKHGKRIYESAISKIDKLMVPLLSFLCRMGQFQLLRKMIQSELQMQSRIETPQLVYACMIANQVTMKTLRERDLSVLKEDCSDEVEKTRILSQAVGAVDPMSTIFLKTDALEGLPSLLALFIIKHMSNVKYDPIFGALRGKDDESFDGWSIVTGIATSLRQFHSSYTKAILALLGQYVISSAEACLLESDDAGIPKEVSNVLVFMRQLCIAGNIKQSALHDYLPMYMMEMFDRGL